MGFYSENNAPPEIIIKNSSLSITQIFNTNLRHTQTYNIPSDFRAVISISLFLMTDFNYLTEINFSIGKIITDQEHSSCDDEEKDIPKDVHKEFDHPFKTLLK